MDLYCLITEFGFIVTAAPGDHLLLFVGCVATAAQADVGWWQKVQAVIFEVLVYEGQQNLR